MRKLIGISFNGIDKQTNLERLKRIQEKYPLSEFGVLLSRNWQENGNRYYNPNELYQLQNLDLNLSAHLCGALAKSAIRNDFTLAQDFCGEFFKLFKRTQLNIVRYGDENPKELILDVPKTLQEVIIQQKSANECKLFMDYYEKHKDNPNNKIVVLIDGSGGLGVDTGLKILTTTAKVGYAGGINEDNVIEKLDFLMNHTQNFWIDMESGVRTNDWFDLDKVEHICEMVYDYLNIK